MDLAMNGMIVFNLFNMFLTFIIKIIAIYTMYLAIKALRVLTYVDFKSFYLTSTYEFKQMKACILKIYIIQAFLYLSLSNNILL